MMRLSTSKSVVGMPGELTAAIGSVLGLIDRVERQPRLFGQRVIITGPADMITPSADAPAMRMKSMLAAPWV